VDKLKLDGNAAAGLLEEVFAVEMTAASSMCDSCGNVEVIGALVVYSYAPGTVFRCPNCDAVLMRIVTDGRRYWVDLSGVRSLELNSA
jgi:predicted RNA-binding Zn-ribbon protein involved in translation (DUF1610 family)